MSSTEQAQLATLCMKHSFRDQWLEGTKLEYDTLLKLNTFRIVPLPEDAQIIPVMWTFVYKFDTNGFLVKFKARMCARGDMQKMTLCFHPLLSRPGPDCVTGTRSTVPRSLILAPLAAYGT